MKFAAIFIAMSRVQKKEHIQLLHHRQNGKKFNPLQAYSYITQLKPDDNVMSFYAGFIDTDTDTDTASSNKGALWSPQADLAFLSTH